MTAFNVVRFKVKPGREQEFLDAHKNRPCRLARHAPLQHGQDRRAHSLRDRRMGRHGRACRGAAAHDQDILDWFRDTLEDLGGGLGVTDPVAGPVVLALK